MRGSLASRTPGLLALAATGVVAGLASGHPELVLLAAPFLVFAGAGLALASEPRLSAHIALERTRLLEGEAVKTTVTVSNQAPRAVWLEFAPARSAQLGIEPSGAVAVRLAGGGEAELEFVVRPRRWGAHRVGPLLVRARDPLGVATWEGRIGVPVDLRAFPREQRLRELVVPLRTQPALGAHVARARGEGIEFADVRPFRVGDRVRRVNWRATARRGSLQVNDRHPEHSSDVVLLLDTYEEARDQAGGTLDSAVRAAAGLARAHLARRDRVGVVDFGGTLQWLEPAFGTTQAYRIVDALLASDIAFSYAWRDVEGIPLRVLPPGALILAITPLLDDRSIGLIIDLRRRGCDLTVVEVSPLGHVSPGPSSSDAVAYRFWRLEREARRAQLQALGIGVAVWEHDVMLGPALEGVNAFRRSARHGLLA
ncbi:MAG TPA: DUF58 domain-containing protein [Solirubrobacteraceae bacterium]|nr:DUF58 domain-containing protein [Solirubrobacteraceae bacterium]